MSKKNLSLSAAGFGACALASQTHTNSAFLRGNTFSLCVCDAGMRTRVPRRSDDFLPPRLPAGLRPAMVPCLGLG
uniref:Putative secreted protein n=1 Tax=Anopheles darlingi TaxID=43151 RepID=A0A2M4D5L8_ANODA